MFILSALFACAPGTLPMDTGAPALSTDEPTSPGPHDGNDDPRGDGPSDTGGHDDTGSDETGDPGETGAGDTDETGAPVVEAEDYRLVGPYGVTSTSGSSTVNGCSMSYERREATGGTGETVILSHGFARSTDNMLGWADHFASWGVDVVVPGLCHASMFDADHEQNGADLVALASSLGLVDVVYAGHSAGGLASVVAGSNDPTAAGVFGLDPVDADGLGVARAGSLTVPMRALIGQPSMCNESSNGTEMAHAAPDGGGYWVSDADHCDFESPTDWMCTAFCSGGNGSFSDDEIQDTIRGLATAFVLWRSGVDPAAEQWWTEGWAWHDDLVATGAVTAL